MEKYYGIIALVILLVVLVIFIKYQANKDEEETEEETVPARTEKSEASPLDLSDEDAVVASLIAGIECRNETNKNVQVISVRKVG